MASQFEPSSDRQTATTDEAREFNGIKSNKESGNFLVEYREMSNEHAARRFVFRTTDPGLIPKQSWMASKSQRLQSAMEKPFDKFANARIFIIRISKEQCAQFSSSSTFKKGRHPGILSVLYGVVKL